jgi:hypothetical protein
MARQLTDKQLRALAKGRKKLRKIRRVMKAHGVSMKTVLRSTKLMRQVDGKAVIRRKTTRPRARRVAKRIGKALKFVPQTVKRWL